MHTAYEGNLNAKDMTLKWKELPSFKTGRYDHASIILHNKIYIIGGDTGIDHDKWTSCEVFDIARNIWSEGPNLPYVMLQLCSVTDNRNTYGLIIGRIYNTGKTEVVVLDELNGFKKIDDANLETSRSLGLVVTKL